MNCEHVTREEIVDKYISGQLDSGLRDEFEVHVLECRKCLELVETYEALRSELVASSAGPACTPREPLPDWVKQAPATTYGDGFGGSDSGVRIGSYMGDEEWWGEEGSTPPIPLGRAGRFSPFRFLWVPVAAALVIAIGVVLVIRRGARLGPPQQEPPRVAQETGANGAKPAGTTDVANASVPAAQGRSQVDQRPAASEAPARSGRPTGATAEAAQQSRASEAAHGVPPLRSDEQPAGAVVSADVTQQKPKSQPGPARSDELAAELFYLGMVEPPAYTFAGFRGSTTGTAAAGQGHSGIGVAGGRINFQEAMLAYVDGRYESAASFLEDARRTEPHAPEINFYLGICRLVRGSSAEAIEALTVATAKRSPVLQSAHFYLAKAYIQADNLVEAEDQLQAAIAVRGRLSTEAKSLLARLRAVRSKMQDQTKAAPEMLP